MSEEKLPKGWRIIKLGKALSLEYGKSLPKKDRSGSGYPVMGSNGIIDEHFEYLIEGPGIIVGRKGSHGEVVWVDQNFYPIDTTYFVVPKPVLELRFAYYFLKKSDLKSLNRSTAIPGLNRTDAYNLDFPLPPLPEQQRIVAKLDAAFGHLDSLREKLDRIPELLKNFRQQVLTQAVKGNLTREWREGKDLGEWEETTFGDVMEGTPKNGAYFSKDLYGSGTRIIRIDAFYDGFLKDWSKLQRVNITKSDQEQYNIQVGDILVNRVNSMEYLGKCMLVDKLPEPCIYESNMMRVRLQLEKITSEFTRVFLTSPIGLKELRKNAKQAVNQASINQKDVMQVEISIPSLNEQHEIVKRVSALFILANKIESHYQSLKAKIDQLPQAVLAKAFRGELVGQEVKEYVREVEELGMVAEGKSDYKRELLSD